MPWAKIVSGLVIALYPVLVYFGLQHVNPRWLALLLVIGAGLRAFGHRIPAKTTIGLVVAVAAATLLTLFTGSELGLLLYPVLMNATLLVVFLTSWFYPPTVIESMARLKEPDLPPSAIAYIRKLTLIWVVFFALNGTLAAITIGLGREIWALYNGLIAYILMATLFLGELAVRSKFKDQHRV